MLLERIQKLSGCGRWRIEFGLEQICIPGHEPPFRSIGQRDEIVVAWVTHAAFWWAEVALVFGSSAEGLHERSGLVEADPAPELWTGEDGGQLVEQLLTDHRCEAIGHHGFDYLGMSAVRIDQASDPHVRVDHDPDPRRQDSARLAAALGSRDGEFLGRDLGGLFLGGSILGADSGPDVLDGSSESKVTAQGFLEDLVLALS